jgi:hypothetical protein
MVGRVERLELLIRNRYLNYLFVNINSLGKGIGDKLMLFIEKSAKYLSLSLSRI